MIRKKLIVFPIVMLVFVVGLTGCGAAELETVFSFVNNTTSQESDEKTEPAADEVVVSDEDISYDTSNDEEGSETDPVVSGERYAYQTLNDTEKEVYEEIVSTFMERREETTIATTDSAELERAYLAVRCDYSGFFWVGNFEYVTYTRGNTVVSIDIQPEYVMSEQEQEDVQQQIDAEVDRMLADVPAEGSDFDKALYVFETLINEVDYNVDAADGQTIVSAFLNHETVCQGYSYATQYLLRQMGIPCMTVTGTANGEPHAWNLVYLDGAYYYMDTTWGNSQYIYRDEQMQDYLPAKFIDYDYFGMTTEWMLRDHQPDDEIPLPECNATADNYYIHEGLYIDEWDPDRIGEILRQGYENGDDMVRIRFSDDELYERAVDYFLTGGNLFSYCPGLRSVHYLQGFDSEVMVVVFN